MEIFLGFMLCLFIELLLWGAYRMHRQMAPPGSVQPPRTPGQLANEAVYEAEATHNPRVVSLRLQRRTKRGRRVRNMEDEHNSFES